MMDDGLGTLGQRHVQGIEHELGLQVVPIAQPTMRREKASSTTAR